GLEASKRVPLSSVTTTLALPVLVSSDDGTAAASWLLLMNVVTKLVPPNCTVAPGTKPEPETNSVKLPLPCWTELGLMLLRLRTLPENGVTVNVRELETTNWFPLNWLTTTLARTSVVKGNSETTQGCCLL